MDKHSTTRFSNRVADYVKYRPGYPAGVIHYLQGERITPDLHIADVGAGTGISSKLFLDAGYRVTAVEPNREMREKAIELLGNVPGFDAVDGTAEHTGLAADSVDVVVAGQAFHWFNARKARSEFKRILTPGGLVVLLWNERKTDSAFAQQYDKLITKHAIDYIQVDHRNIDYADIADFYDPDPFELQIFKNQQVFDFEGLKGRLFSSSYMPVQGEAGYDETVAELQELFDRYKENGTITIHYDTKVYLGRIGA
ncbi:Ubiquinone/menaquinone biosynthesis C-methylase UbiE [bacterium A37T11]|nr:Ubiquinone/menaquinone biosynthesis C-methylase UbiE [bacterium A37T11]